jgi:hypothetical protein
VLTSLHTTWASYFRCARAPSWMVSERTRELILEMLAEDGDTRRRYVVARAGLNLNAPADRNQGF